MKHIKTLAFSLSLMALTSPAYAVVDAPNVMLNLLRQIQSAIEVVENILNNIQLVELNTLLGEKGAEIPSIADLSSHVDFKQYAPTLPSDLQGVVGNAGFESIPDVKQYVQTNFASLQATDVTAQAAAIVAINERLNLSAMDAFQKAKNVGALTNEAAKEASSQLSKSGSAKDMHKKLVQEAGQDIQALKKDVALNQLNAQLLQTEATAIVAKMQHSTADGDDAKTEDKKDTSSSEGQK